MGASAAVTVASSLRLAHTVQAAGSDQIRIALVGCGGRGTGAAVQALQNSSGAKVKVVAMADAFRNRLDTAYRVLEKRHPEQLDVPEERKFVGLDPYQKAIDCETSRRRAVRLCDPRQNQSAVTRRTDQTGRRKAKRRLARRLSN